MPLHDYLCGKCGKTSEILQAVGEKSATICPFCGGKLKKLISAPAIQFKGTGWYVTDYARKGSASTSSEKTESAESASKSESAEKQVKVSEAAASKETGASEKSGKPAGPTSGKRRKG